MPGSVHRVLAGAVGACALATLCGCTPLRILWHNYEDIDDYRIFDNRVVAASTAPSPVVRAPLPGDVLDAIPVARDDGRTVAAADYLAETKTVALLVQHDDRLVIERYYRGHDESSLVNGFSIAKGILSALTGIAIGEEHIRSINQTVAEFLPEFADNPYGKVTIDQLLNMTSGMSFDLTFRAYLYYSDDLRATLSQRARPHASPGAHWQYKDSDAQVLGLVLARATGRPLTDYLREKLWQPLGMEFAALWSLDRAEHGVEKAFCCVHARARDFARLGALYLNEGRAGGRQIVPAAWVAASTDQRAGHPGHGHFRHLNMWRIPDPPADDFYLKGSRGQFIYVNRRARVVIVKLSDQWQDDPIDFFRAVAQRLGRARSPWEVANSGRVLTASSAPNLAFGSFAAPKSSD